MTPDLITSEMVRKTAWELLKVHAGGRDLLQRTADGREITVRIENFSLLNVAPDLIEKWEPYARAALTAILPDVIEACAKVADASVEDYQGYGLPCAVSKDIARIIRSLSPPTTKERT